MILRNHFAINIIQKHKLHLNAIKNFSKIIYQLYMHV